MSHFFLFSLYGEIIFLLLKHTVFIQKALSPSLCRWDNRALNCSWEALCRNTVFYSLLKVYFSLIMDLSFSPIKIQNSITVKHTILTAVHYYIYFKTKNSLYLLYKTDTRQAFTQIYWIVLILFVFTLLPLSIVQRF